MAFLASFLIRRLAQAVVIVFLVSLLIFTILRIVPGDPVRLMLGPAATPETVERMADRLGLNRPIIVQYAHYIRQVVLHGDFGTSFFRPKSGMVVGGSRVEDPTRLDRAEVLDLIRDRLPLTLQLAGLALVFAVIIAVPLGVLAGIYHGRLPDTSAILTSSVMISLPNFWLGLILALLIGIKLGWLPAVGYKGFSYVILPAIVLAIELASVLVRAIAISLHSAMNESYVAEGQMRGLSRSRMIWRHASRNAAVPVLNLFGIQLGALLGGVLVVEFIFDYPGLGLLTIMAVLQRDFPLIQGLTILISAIFVFVNIIVDYISSLIDPRLDY